MGSTLLIVLVAALTLIATFLIYLGVLPSQFLAEASELKGDEDTTLAVFKQLIINKLSVRLRKYMPEKWERKVQYKIIKAGEPEGIKPEDMLAMMVLSGIVGVLFVLLIVGMLGKSLSVVPIGMIGAFMPMIWLNDLVKKRHFYIRRALPYALDLLTLSVEAGLDFSAAVAMVVEKGQKGPLREEFSILLKEMRMGKTRSEALRNLMERVDLKALNVFIRSLIQADKMGTSLGKILRIQSAQMRIERTQRAEKLAGEAPVKMLGPLIMCIFPTIFIVLFAPIIYKMVFNM